MEDKPYTQYFMKEKEEKVATQVLYRILFVMLIVFIMFFSVNYVFNQKYEYITISGQSMQSTLNNEAVLSAIVSDGKTTYNWVQDGVYIEKTKDIDYSDIIILEKSSDKTIIKRALAFGGDYITIVKNEQGEYRLIRIKENSNKVEVLDEDYIKSYQEWSDDGQAPQDGLTPQLVYEPTFYSTFFGGGYQSKQIYIESLQCNVTFFQVPENELFVLGDNRNHSADSRETGTISIDNIRGKVVEIVKNGTHYKGNDFYFLNRLKGYFSLIWKEILGFFGANI
ncbi:MAG: signal peptidase I [Clostridiales bacterium]|nr:signal peptidase I [Clostridiales bacterium]